MAIHKHKLSYDPSLSDDYDVVASYLRASDGTLITHTGGALDVNIDNASIVVTATDLDIRDLSATQDNVAISDGTDTLAVNADGSLNITDNGGSLTVDAVDLDIRDLSATSDSVAISDGTDTLAIEADGSINVNASEAGYSSCNNAAVTITTSATDVVATELATRKELTIQNVGSRDVYIGCDNTVTTANGLLVPKGATASFRFGAAIDVHAIADGANSEIRILELA